MDQLGKYKKSYASHWPDYELIDAGGGKKLERWGEVITIRPEVQAYFRSEYSFKEWENLAHWEFVPSKGQSGTWKKLKPEASEKWSIAYDDLRFNLALTQFKHVGLFQEQNINWKFIHENLKTGDRFLNLFAYTGAASIVAKSTGAEVIHVDSVRQLVSWAKENMELNALDDIRWVVEDALLFAGREQKRNRKYKGIIMDPPAWGIGAKKEKWKLKDKLPELLNTASELLQADGFLILNTYSPTISLKEIQELAQKYFPARELELTELWMKSTTGKELYYGNLLRVLGIKS